MRTRRSITEAISLTITVALVLVLLGAGAILAWQVTHGYPADSTIARIFEGLLLMFATAWKTEHGQMVPDEVER